MRTALWIAALIAAVVVAAALLLALAISISSSLQPEEVCTINGTLGAWAYGEMAPGFEALRSYAAAGNTTGAAEALGEIFSALYCRPDITVANISMVGDEVAITMWSGGTKYMVVVQYGNSYNMTVNPPMSCTTPCCQLLVAHIVVPRQG